MIRKKIDKERYPFLKVDGKRVKKGDVLYYAEAGYYAKAVVLRSGRESIQFETHVEGRVIVRVFSTISFRTGSWRRFFWYEGQAIDFHEHLQLSHEVESLCRRLIQRPIQSIKKASIEELQKAKDALDVIFLRMKEEELQ